MTYQVNSCYLMGGRTAPSYNIDNSHRPKLACPLTE